MRKRVILVIVLFTSFITGGYSSLPQFFQEEISFLAKMEKKESLNENVATLLREGYLERKGADRKLRADFVTIQAWVEHAIAKGLGEGKLVHFNGAIHTPAPATPLCIAGNIDEFLATKEVMEDRSRWQTIQLRASTLRQILQKKGKLFIIYSKEGMNARSSDQKAAFFKTCQQHKEYLVNCPITSSIEDEFIGATYLFSTPEGKKYLFSIQATQANDARDNMTWKIWLDELSLPHAKKRLELVEAYLEKKTLVSLFNH